MLKGTRDNQQTNSTAGGRVLSPVRVGSPPPHPRNSVIGSVGSDPHPFTQHHSMLLSSLMGNRLIIKNYCLSLNLQNKFPFCANDSNSNRYSPSQSPRLATSVPAGGLPSPSTVGRPPVVVATPPIGIGPEGPWVPRSQPVVPLSPIIAPPPPPPPLAPIAVNLTTPIQPRLPLPTYHTSAPAPGPSFSRRGRPPSDVNAPRQESSAPAADVPAAIAATAAASVSAAAVAVPESRPNPPPPNQVNPKFQS